MRNMAPQRNGSRTDYIFTALILVLSACCFKTGTADSQLLDTFNIVQHLPEHLKHLETIGYLKDYYDIKQERQDIIKKIRDMANYLEKTHSYSWAANLVGTSLSIASVVLYFFGMIADSYNNPELSKTLKDTGKQAGISGTALSLGTSIYDEITFKRAIASLEKDLLEHNKRIQKHPENDSHQFLLHAIACNSTLKELKELSDKEWKELLYKIPLMLKNAFQVTKYVNQVTYPAVKQLLQKWSLPTDSKSQHILHDASAQLIKNSQESKEAIKNYLIYLDKPEWARLAIIYKRSTGLSVTDGSKIANYAIDFLSNVKAFIANNPLFTVVLPLVKITLDVRKMNTIWNETGEPPRVEQLRDMADKLEEEFNSMK